MDLLSGMAGSRLLPPDGYLMNSVDVESDDNGAFTVKMFPVNCSYPFETFTSAVGGQVTKVASASPPVTGTFDISYGEQRKKGTFRLQKVIYSCQIFQLRTASRS